MQHCYCIFEGGGAKGIAHVGALSALEDAGIERIGYAGTSAGAIVAALAAAGYASHEILSGSSSILDILDKDRSNIWDGPACKPLVSAPRLLGRAGWTAIQITGLITQNLISTLIFYFVLMTGVLHLIGILGEWQSVILQSILLLLVPLLLFYLARPVAHLEGFRFAINQALRLRLVGDRASEAVTFRNMHDFGQPPLKIVASNISRREATVFSFEDTPDVAVADAVAASVCLPGIFRPWQIGDDLYFDGGLVSNMPAWVFDDERSIDRDAWTAAVEVADKPEPKRRLWGVGVLASMFDTAIFGSSVLNTRGVERLRSVSLKINAGLLHFGMKAVEAVDIVEYAKERCNAELVQQIISVPQLVSEICSVASEACIELLNVGRDDQKLPLFSGRLRARLLFPLRRDGHALISEHEFGCSGDADERARIPIIGTVAGKAWTDRDVIFADRADLLDSPAFLNRAQDRWARKVYWRELQWGLYVPHYHAASDAWVVLAVESDEAVYAEDYRAMQDLAEEIEDILEASLPLDALQWL